MIVRDSIRSSRRDCRLIIVGCSFMGDDHQGSCRVGTDRILRINIPYDDDDHPIVFDRKGKQLDYLYATRRGKEGRRTWAR